MTFAIGHGYAVYRGRTTGDGGYHRHAAFQVAIAAHGEVTMAGAATEHRAAVLVVPPMVGHRIGAVADLRTFFVEPHSVFADRLRARCGDGITAVPSCTGCGRRTSVPARPPSWIPAWSRRWTCWRTAPRR